MTRREIPCQRCGQPQTWDGAHCLTKCLCVGLDAQALIAKLKGAVTLLHEICGGRCADCMLQETVTDGKRVLYDTCLLLSKRLEGEAEVPLSGRRRDCPLSPFLKGE